LKHDVERAGFTSLAFGLGLRRLIQKQLIETAEEFDAREGDSYPVARVTSQEWDWIEANEQMFTLKKGQAPKDDFDDDIPF